MLYTITLQLDEDDFGAVQYAMAARQRICPPCDGESNIAGATLADICRGWLEVRGEWPGESVEGD